MKKLSILLLAGCATSEPLPDYASRYRPASAAPAPRAAEPPVEVLSLEGALELAERAHPRLAEMRARIRAAEGRALQEGLLPNPSLIARVESAPFEGRTGGDAEYLAGISQPLPVGGRLGEAREAGRLEAERLGRESDVDRARLRARVHGAFATALFAAEVERLQAELLGLARRAVVLARVRRDAGDATADEVARAELEEARARLEEDKADGLRELAFVALAAAVGTPERRIGAVEGRLEAAFELPSMDAILAALDDGPHAALARAELDAAEARIARARAERIPDVTLDLLYRRIGETDTDAFDAGLSVPLPVFDRNQGRLREAKAEARSAEARARTARGEAVRQLREARVKLAEALTHVRLAREEILPRAKTVLDAAEARHAAGDLSLADLIPIRRDHAAGRLSYLEGLREAMEAWGELKAYLPESK